MSLPSFLLVLGREVFFFPIHQTIRNSLGQMLFQHQNLKESTTFFSNQPTTDNRYSPRRRVSFPLCSPCWDCYYLLLAWLAMVLSMVSKHMYTLSTYVQMPCSIWKTPFLCNHSVPASPDLTTFPLHSTDMVTKPQDKI